MGGKQSSVSTERYHPNVVTDHSATSPTSRNIHDISLTMPRTAHQPSPMPPPLPPRRERTWETMNPNPPEPRLEPPLRPAFLFNSPPSPPTLFEPSHTNSLPYRSSRHQLANRPLPTLPPSSSDHQSFDDSRRHNRLLDLESLLAGLDEIGPPESHRVRSSTHRHHRPRLRDLHDSRNRDLHDSRNRDQHDSRNRDILNDPLLFLRSLARTRCCPNCSENIPIHNYDDHVSECVPKPKVQYNDDLLTANSGECSICLEDMSAGDKIARLPCLCTYHIMCIEDWFKRKPECPQHPDLKLPTV